MRLANIARFISCFAVFTLVVFSTLPSAASDYTGSNTCQTCHADQFSEWQGSHHDMAMRHADDTSVLGDFNNIELTFRGHKQTFSKKDQQFWLTFTEPGKQPETYQIKYTFGYEPLQQYMVEFEDGRVQLIPFAWDSRPESEGGQRWFDLYPELDKPHHEFYWKNVGQNWNFMCADCHSTNLQKNYNAATDTYDTTFSEINVGCEACHGPASDHLAWAKAPDDSVAFKGFDRDLRKQVANWLNVDGKTTLQPESIHPTQQVQTCAQCHSRRLQINEDDHIAGGDIHQRYLVSRIDSGLYYPDGQIYDEVYVHGSFMQSRMQQMGVTCTNCHNPHTAQLMIPKEAVCLQCHQPDTYTQTSHHGHPLESEGAQCVNCHMPETTYMEVDPRRDHGWHSPKPVIAQRTGSRDVCLDCHQDKDSDWSLAQVERWHPGAASRAESHFAQPFLAGDYGMPQALASLSNIAQDKNNTGIIRGSALDRMQNIPGTNGLIAIARGAKDPDTHVRLGAVEGAASLQLKERWRILSPLLNDIVLAVRVQAALRLVPGWQQMNLSQRNQLQPALDEYLKTLEYNADRGFSHTSKGDILKYMGDNDGAEKAYLQGIYIEPYYAPAYINLADFYRASGQEQKAIDTLQQGLAAQPEDGNIPYSLGLAMIRTQQRAQASEYLKLASELAPQNAQFHYVYALSTQDSEPNEAMKALRRAWEAGGNPQHLFTLCEMQIKQGAFQANQCLQQLSQVAPEQAVMQLRQLQQQLRGR